MDEVYAMMRIFKCGYRDVMKMPTRERRFFLYRYKHEKEEIESNADSSQSVQNNGKGKTQRRIQGEELKQKLRKGEIPDQ